MPVYPKRVEHGVVVFAEPAQKFFLILSEILRVHVVEVRLQAVAEKILFHSEVKLGILLVHVKRHAGRTQSCGY